MPSATQELRRRFLTLDPTDADTDTFELSFSSETPVARQYGDEVLSHAAGAVDLARLNDSAPLLFNHNQTSFWAWWIAPALLAAKAEPPSAGAPLQRLPRNDRTLPLAFCATSPLVIRSTRWIRTRTATTSHGTCLLYTSDAADE